MSAAYSPTGRRKSLWAVEVFWDTSELSDERLENSVGRLQNLGGIEILWSPLKISGTPSGNSVDRQRFLCAVGILRRAIRKPGGRRNFLGLIGIFRRAVGKAWGPSKFPGTRWKSLAGRWKNLEAVEIFWGPLENSVSRPKFPTPDLNPVETLQVMPDVPNKVGAGTLSRNGCAAAHRTSPGPSGGGWRGFIPRGSTTAGLCGGWRGQFRLPAGKRRSARSTQGATQKDVDPVGTTSQRVLERRLFLRLWPVIISVHQRRRSPLQDAFSSFTSRVDTFKTKAYPSINRGARVRYGIGREKPRGPYARV